MYIKYIKLESFTFLKIVDHIHMSELNIVHLHFIKRLLDLRFYFDKLETQITREKVKMFEVPLQI